ncbi:outer membrane receptor protein involved in Fe transport [Pseudoduganella lurida]|uniref:Outer membrane receptor protein involved in Fe transport n=2 Tax=Pseudoduganella lurida TaxID=1036180 RepID=A0A562RE97_9BURK|nr:outer membrane receptor protein involved in Fe transport [Pseudoduganella lurida]
MSLALLGAFAGAAHAQTGTVQPDGAAAVEPVAADGAAPKAQAVVVVGKRGQTVANTPGGASAVSGEALTKIGAESFADYLGKLPGVVFNAGPNGNSTAVIRGVGTTAGLDQGQGTTGYYINEIPLSEVGYTISIPDIDTFDVSRVEVLRGPQGSLYGSSSLGGAINYIAKEADTSGLDAAFETVFSKTAHAGELGFSAKAMLNVPLIQDKLAARVVMVKREMPGYLDNIGIGRKGSNDNRVTDGRVSLVWTPDALTKLSWMSLRQSSFADDSSYRMTRYGELARSTTLPTSFEQDFSLHSARLERDFGAAKLTAIASYNKKSQELHDDFTPYYGGFMGTSDPQLFRQLGTSKNKNYEVRLASPDGGRFEWLVGVSYQKTDKRFDEDLSAQGANAVLAPQVPAEQLRGDYYYWGYGGTYGTDKGLFGEASVNFGDGWKLTAGGRRYDTRLSTDGARDGVLYPGGVLLPDGYQQESGFSPKISLSYKPNAQTMVYALASEGFRFGGANILLPLAGFDTPTGWGSDSLRNYEIGVKSSLFNRRLTFDVDVFNIDWSDLQVRLYRPDDLSYGTNAGRARLRGLEFSGNFRATDQLDVGLNYTFLDAKLTEDLLEAAVPLHKGQQLPGSSKHQLSTTATYKFDGKYSPTATVSGRYLSDAPANLQGTGQRINGFAQFDARYAMWFDNLELSLFVNNIADKRGVTFTYGSDANLGNQEFIIRPRTAGVRLHWQL